ARWLDGAIESVRRQTLSDWELLVVDDGSTDDTRAVVQRHATDRRIHYLPGPHLERSAARNRGLAAARGALVAFLDADDRWLPEKLERQLAALDAEPDVALSYTTDRPVRRRGGRPRPRPKAAARDRRPSLPGADARQLHHPRPRRRAPPLPRRGRRIRRDAPRLRLRGLGPLAAHRTTPRRDRGRR